MRNYPTAWQRKLMWAALSAFFTVLLIAVAASAIWVVANLLSFLQPILIPVAIAVILAYLFDPLVTKLERGLLTRTKAILLIFAVAFLFLAGLIAWVAPTVSMQSANFARELPNYTQKARDRIVDVIVRFNRTFAAPSRRGKTVSPSSGIVNLLLGTPSPQASAAASATPVPPPAAVAPGASVTPAPVKLTSADRQRLQAYFDQLIPNLERNIPTLAAQLWDILKKSIGGFLGFTGFLLSLVLVPIYLFFLLKERPRIERRWKDYLPLRDSPLKNEIAEVLSQINDYIIAYFRGQLLVCLVDGVLIGSALMLFGLNFAALIGMLVVILTMVPYIGIVLCWVPAVLIAAFQWGDWWHPFWVTVIFVVIQNLEGMFYAPRIVGNSVGLHPMTVIVSIFVWGLLIGGVLGPILAVPLTATLKVLLMRYVWAPRVREEEIAEIEQVPVVAESERAKA
ncbi:MAG TPA: AI-2E family transporter [Chthoniobacterales bacterium]|nr:AI-2E family transporter [Chthoniobacterales bacterium]